METEIHFLLYRLKHRDKFPQNLTLLPSWREQEIQVCTALAAFTLQCPLPWSSPTLQRRKWLVPIPLPCAPSLVPIPLGQCHHIQSHRQHTAQFRGCHPISDSMNGAPWSCAMLLLEYLANCYVLRLTSTRPQGSSWITVTSVSLAPSTVPGTE